MSVRIEFETENDGLDSPIVVGNIVHAVANDILDGHDGGFISDPNGNTIGRWTWDEAREGR